MKYVIFVVPIFLLACAHENKIRPYKGAVHHVSVRSEDPYWGSQRALSRANAICEDQYAMMASIVSEKTKYVGDMDEQDYKKARMASRVLKTGSHTYFGGSGKAKRKTRRMVRGSGNMIDSAVGQAYFTQMDFKCI